MLLLPGPEHRSKEQGGIVVAGQQVKIVEEGNRGRGTAWCVWDGSIVLVRYLEATVDILSKGLSRIVELGAGTGMAGICTAVLFPNVCICLTDIHEALPSLHHNVALNKALVGERVSVEACDWTNPNDTVVKAPWDVVIATDVVWLEELVEPFVDTLDTIVKFNPKCFILMSYQSRTRRVDELLFRGLSQRGFSTDVLPVVEQEPPRRKIQLFKIHK